MKRNNEEHEHQAAFFQRLDLATRYYPYLRWIYAVPNGGNRNLVTASFLKREGVRRGIADVCVPIPSQGFHGAYIEFKAGKNKLTKEQSEFLEFVKGEGYEVATVWTVDEAVDFIEEYFGINLSYRREAARSDDGTKNCSNANT